MRPVTARRVRGTLVDQDACDDRADDRPEVRGHLDGGDGGATVAVVTDDVGDRRLLRRVEDARAEAGDRRHENEQGSVPTHL